MALGAKDHLCTCKGILAYCYRMEEECCSHKNSSTMHVKLQASVRGQTAESQYCQGMFLEGFHRGGGRVRPAAAELRHICRQSVACYISSQSVPAACGTEYQVHAQFCISAAVYLAQTAGFQSMSTISSIQACYAQARLLAFVLSLRPTAELQPRCR